MGEFRRLGAYLRGKSWLVESLSHPPTSFSAPVKVTSLPQVPGRKKNRQSGIDEFFKIAAKCSDKDKDLSSNKTSNKTSDKDKMKMD